MKIFTFYFKDGKMLVLQGFSAANALTKANLRREDLSFYEEGKCEDYTWSESHNKWASTNSLSQSFK